MKKHRVAKNNHKNKSRERPVTHASSTIARASTESHVTRLQASAVTLHQQGQLVDAEAIYREILQLQPNHFDALQLLGTVCIQRNNYAAALELLDKALSINSSNPSSLHNRGVALKELNRYEEALEVYDKALALKPDYAEAYYNRGVALLELKRYQEAVASNEKAISLTPDHFMAYSNLGNALQELCRYEEAVGMYDKALALKPDYAEAYYNRGFALREMKRFEEALESYGKALVLKPNLDYLVGECLHTKMRICDWSMFDRYMNELSARIKLQEKAIHPFPVLGLFDSLSIQKEAAMILVQDKYAVRHALPDIINRKRCDTIRIGYFSTDFRNHPLSFLMAELIELHDRGRFEIYAFSFGPDIHDEMRKRLESAFDKFIDVKNLSEKDVALLSRSLKIDIAIDLGGFTKHSRTGIFAFRAAPIQVNYMGYPGTMGAEYIDYIIADKILIPEECKHQYSERIIYLPYSYQINDRKRKIAEIKFTKEELGLPKKGFVFCCFNNNYKIIPKTFDGWMRILKEVEESVLWLFEDNSRVASNLRQEAVRRGIDADRLIFAKKLPLSEHLARYRRADLFLDTLPYNAHTTASDALWAGLPVLTCIGESFVSRVGASLLNAIHLPELITATHEEYESLAIELATNPEKLRKIREKLKKNRLTTPLFDTPSVTRYIEEAYVAMFERYQAGLSFDHIYISNQISLTTLKHRRPKRPTDSKLSESGTQRSSSRDSHVARLQSSAFTLHQQGDLDQAEVIYNKILQLQPNHFDALQLLATIAVQRKNFSQAVVLFEQALKINQSHLGSLNNYGNALFGLKMYDEALQSYEKALAIKPDYIEAHAHRVAVRQELKKQDDTKSFITGVLQVKSRLRAIESMSLDEQRKMQETQLRNLFRHAYQYSDWWRVCLSSAGYSQDDTDSSLFSVLENIPPLLRTDVQEHFEAIRAWRNDWSEKDITISTTSGSTGLPVRVEKFRAEYDLIYAAVSLVDHEWHDRDARQPLVSLSDTEDSVHPDWGQLLVAIQGRATVTNRYASNRSALEHAAWLMEQRPIYLKATSYRAAEIAELLVSQGKKLPLHHIISQYERVTPHQREVCRKAFCGAKIIDRYSCEETGWLALQCPKHEHLHVMAGTTIIEIVDGNLKPCPIGVPGRVLVTNMQSYAMPIIRYDIGDIAEWGEECDCGIKLPVISRLWGRKRNLIMVPDGELRPMPFLGDDVGKMRVIKEYRIVQQKNREIDFLVRADRPLSEDEVNLLCSYIHKIDAQLVVNIREVSAIDWGEGLKREEFVRVE